MKIDLDQFRETFFAESLEHLQTLESNLLLLDSSSTDGELLNSIFRAAHSIKGASGTFGFEDIAKFTHVLENLLDRLRDGKIAPTKQLVDLLLSACDVLASLVEAAKSNSPAPPVMESVLEELKISLGLEKVDHAITTTTEPAHASSSAKYRVSFTPSADMFRQGLDPILLLDDLAEVGEIVQLDCDDSRLPSFDELNPESCYLSWTILVISDQSDRKMQEVFCFVDEETKIDIKRFENDTIIEPLTEQTRPSLDAETQTTKTGSTTAAVDRRGDRSSIRVSIDKIDKLVNLVEELVITQSILNQIVEVSDQQLGSALEEIAATMDRNLRELQERVMAVRMVPISSVTGRFPRLVRELSENLAKSIRFEIVGEETELDKQVVEQIGDPLMHLIRNSADHGLESPIERVASGKPEQGLIKLRAAQEGDSVIIEVSDDGRGLNLTKIREKALARGLMKPDETVTDDQIREFIFHPGFSTAEKVTNVSGRGVGMDVVRSNIQSMKGSVRLFSELGKGTRIRIKLPLSVAILDGLCLGVGDDVYIVPLLNVTESLRPTRTEIKPMMGRGTVIMVREEALPLWPLGDLLEMPGNIIDPCDGLVVIIEGDGRRYGLLVDEVLGQSQVVIKTIETNFRKVDGITGATILGDGRVAMILDVHALSRIAQRWKRDERRPAKNKKLKTLAIR